MESGARRAHGYLEEKITPQTFHFKGMAEQALDVCSLKSMEQDRNMWCTAWGCCDAPGDIPAFGAHPVPVMGLPSADNIKGVSKRFTPNTCQPAGHPRHYSLLGEDTRAVFG
eukprot:1368082-Pyramimonas_sp.AAC.1